MQTCYFYTKIWDEAVAALPPDAELIDVSKNHTAYWEEISARWGSDDLTIVEHDIVIHETVLSQFQECPNQWCLFPYWSHGWFDRCLGCTRFRKEIQQEVSTREIQRESWGSCWECNPDATVPSVEDMRDLGKWAERNRNSEIQGCWRHLDGKISYSLSTLRGYEPCVHLPAVEHLTHRVPEGEFYVRSWES